MTGVNDLPTRAAALDPRASFCVSAPAGSGKTELLIQRYLCLLSRVEAPRTGTCHYLYPQGSCRNAPAGYACAAVSPCWRALRRSTPTGYARTGAEKALAADKREGWRVLQNIARFNIKTIDSFCAGLTRQMPVLSQFGGQARLQDDATPLYGEAVQELFKLLEENHPVARRPGGAAAAF